MGEYIAWTPELSVSVEEIDEQHRELLEQLDRFLAAALRGEARQKMKNLVEFLLQYVDLHFRTEEYFMVKYQYPAYIAHKKEHERLTEAVRKTAFQIRTGRPTRDMVVELGSQMGHWVAEHIQRMDKRLGMFLKSLGRRLDSSVPEHLRMTPMPTAGAGVSEGTIEWVCPHFECCVHMFNRFQDDDSRQFWIERFCRASRSVQCHRQRILGEGARPDKVPMSLLPNGDHLLHFL